MKAVLFPGQGSQFVGIGSDLYQKFDFVKKIFETVDQTLGFSLTKIILEGPENEEEEFVLTDMIIEPENEEEDDEFLPDTLLTLFGDVNIDGDLEIELDEEPQKMRGSRKWRK